LLAQNEELVSLNEKLNEKYQSVEHETDSIVRNSERINYSKYLGKSLVRKVSMLLEDKELEIKSLQ
jgi:hypothetical protein